MGRSTCVAVLSVHRSGSSCVAGVLHALGVSMGSRLVGASPSNRLGHFEDDVLGSIHRQMVGGNWREPELDAEPHMGVYRYQIRQRENQPVWGVKDPRLCFVFPYLVDALSPETELRVIRMARQLDHVVESILMRARREPNVEYLQIEHQDAETVTNLYNGALETSLKGWNGPLLTVDFDELVADRTRGVAEVADFVGIPSNSRAVNMVLPGLKHI